MALEPAPDTVTDQLAHAHEPGALPLVACDDCGCLIVPAYIRTHTRVCPGAPRTGLTAFARRILGLKP